MVERVFGVGLNKSSHDLQESGMGGGGPDARSDPVLHRTIWFCFVLVGEVALLEGSCLFSPGVGWGTVGLQSQSHRKHQRTHPQEHRNKSDVGGALPKSLATPTAACSVLIGWRRTKREVATQEGPNSQDQTSAPLADRCLNKFRLCTHLVPIQVAFDPHVSIIPMVCPANVLVVLHMQRQGLFLGQCCTNSRVFLSESRNCRWHQIVSGPNSNPQHQGCPLSMFQTSNRTIQ